TLRLDQVAELPGNMIGCWHWTNQQIGVRQVAEIRSQQALGGLQRGLDRFLTGHAEPPGRREETVSLRAAMARRNSRAGLSAILGDRKSSRLNSSHVAISYAV